MFRSISRSIRAAVVAMTACAALAGCNTTGTTRAAAPGYATQSYTPSNFQLPAGKGCSGAISRWQAVQQNDYASGNVNQSVYQEIQGEIAKASEACSAGRDAEAQAMVASSKRRHGYPG